MSKRDLVHEYRLYLQVEKGLADNSLASYRQDLARLTDWAERCGVAPEHLTRPQLRLWIADLSKSGLAASSVTRAVSAVRGFFKWLLLDRHLDENPAEDLDTPQSLERLPNYLSESEINALLDAPDTTTENGLLARAILELLYATGLRVSEVVALRLSEIDWEAGTLICQGKGSKQRRVPIGKSALRWLNFYRLQRAALTGEKWPNLFLNSRGGPLTRGHIAQLVKRYAAQAGLVNVTPHTLRHTYATHLMQGGADVRSVQLLLGHSDINTTQIYTHLTAHQIRQTYNLHHPRARATFTPQSSEP